MTLRDTSRLVSKGVNPSAAKAMEIHKERARILKNMVILGQDERTI